MNDLVSRCAKRVFRQYIQSVSSPNLSLAVAHFLNCYLSSSVKLNSTSSSSASNASATTNGTQANAGATTATEKSKEEPVAEQTAVNKSTWNKKRKKNQRKGNKAGSQKFSIFKSHFLTQQGLKYLNREFKLSEWSHLSPYRFSNDLCYLELFEKYFIFRSD